MDFWARLLAGAGVKQQSSSNPQQRLSRFRRIYDQVRQTYQKTPLLQQDSQVAETIRTCFQRITTILHDESRSPHPHLCLSFAAEAQIYQTIARIGAVAQDEGVIREAIAVFDALIDGEDEFLTDQGFAKALMTFVDRTAGAGNLFVSEDVEGEIIELLFGIAAKIRLQPEILPEWFTSSAQARAQRQREHDNQNEFVGVTSKEDFPLCYQLIDHVHHEGRMGDFARTGLLYIFESASKSSELEQWIVDSDLPTLMASGLGALYSQLSRKLSILHPQSELPVVLQLSDYLESRAPRQAESLFSDHLQRHMETFLSYLTFWQDVLEHCHSVDVRQTLLDHFQVLFLRQLLYPSLLESSDVDGGSSVAVLTYLRRILTALDHVELVDLILQYLLAMPGSSLGASSILFPNSDSRMRRVSSRILIQSAAEDDDGDDDDDANPELFSLADLMQGSVRSSNPQTVISALKLAAVVLSKNHSYMLDTLIKIDLIADDQPPRRTVGALNAELDAYLSLAEEIGGRSGMDEAYDNLVHDAQRHLEIHGCSARILSLASLGVPMHQASPTSTAPSAVPVVSAHTLRDYDRFSTQLLSMLDTFFINNVEENLALTETLIALASCPKLQLEGWASVEPSHYQFDHPTPSNSDSETLSNLQLARRRPYWSSQFTPALMIRIQTLRSQVQILKSMFPSLPQLVAARKQAFRLHEEVSEAMQKTPPPKFPTPSRRSSEQNPTITSVLPQRIFDNNGSPSRRSDSPRGRRLGAPDLRAASTTSPSPKPNSRSIFSNYTPSAGASPSRSGMASTDAMPAEPRQMGLLNDVLEGANSEVLSTRLKFPFKSEAANEHTETEVQVEIGQPEDHNDNTSRQEENSDSRDASLSHVITNVVILQEFILELVAVMQVRASMFGEVKFS